jgi:hypothetical protein
MIHKLKLTRVVAFVIVCLAGAIAAATQFDIRVEHQPVKYQTRYVRLPNKGGNYKRNGKLSEAECRAIPMHTSYDKLIETYGLPKDQSYEDAYLYGPWYPVTDRPAGSLCELSGYDDTVRDKELVIQLGGGV